MAVQEIVGSVFLSDGILFVRDSLRANIGDPGSRGDPAQFIFTSYPKVSVKYPIITVKDSGISNIRRLGMGCEQTAMDMAFEVRVWARNVKERDILTQEVFYHFQSNQFGSGSETANVGLHDFNMSSMVNVDEPGEQGLKSKVMEYNYLYINQ